MKGYTEKRSLHECPACVTGPKGYGTKEGEVVAIKNANACDGGECKCRCHVLWADLQARRVPIGKP